MGWMMEQPNKLRISGSLLARNTLLNLIGQAVPLSVGVVTSPFIVRGLGTEHLGLSPLCGTGARFKTWPRSRVWTG